MPRKAMKKNASNLQVQTATGSSGSAPNAVSLLKSDHRKVESLFAQYENAASHEEKEKLARQICKELIVHTLIEEEIFYPQCREHGVEDDALDEAQVEHDGAKILITELISGSPDDEFFNAKVKVLSEYIALHVQEEEKPRSGIFAKAQKAGVDLDELGQELLSRKRELTGAVDENRLHPPEPRAFYPEQAAQDRQRRKAYGKQEISRYRGEEGQRRGWYGDREGHAEAAERGWESRSRGGHRGGEHGREFGEDEQRGGYSRERRHGGWFGDPDGHSQAARRGHGEIDDEDQRRREFVGDEDRRGRGRSGAGRYEDEDRRGYRGRNDR